MFSLREVSKRLGVAYWRISYAHASGAVREPTSRFAGRRLYTETDVTALAQHFGVQPGEEPDKGDQCASSSIPGSP